MPGSANQGPKVERQKNSRHVVCTGRGNAPLICEVNRAGEIVKMEAEKEAQADWPTKFVTQGLIDIQVNGFAGIDFNSDTLSANDMDVALGALAASGVTIILPTLITAHEPELLARLARLDEAVTKSVLGPLMVPGYHIEGPFLSPKEGSSGAHPAAAMRAASRELVIKLEEISSLPLLIMTLAPEQEGVLDLIPFLVERGTICAIGHTAASRLDIDAAIRAGATLSTHLGNGLPHVLNKHENPLFSQLGRDELTASFIADGIHVHPETLKTYLRAKTLARTIIVTDAVSAAGADLEPGLYGLGKIKIERHDDGAVRIPGSAYLAGSSATMDQMVRNLMDWFGYSMDEILQIARANPSQIIGDFARLPQVGARADFVHWTNHDGQLQVMETFVGPWRIKN
jgi:N-acetylglucosamine-6-phosphate deacetylase